MTGKIAMLMMKLLELLRRLLLATKPRALVKSQKETPLLSRQPSTLIPVS